MCKGSKGRAAKEEDELTSYLILDVLEIKIFRCDFMERHNV